MKENISGIHQKRTSPVEERDKKESKPLESWMIEEYFVPYQAS